MIQFKRKLLGLSYLLLSLIICLCSSDLNAQVLPDERLVSAEFVEIPLDSALLLLSVNSGVGISFDPAIIPEDKRATLSANRLHLGLALDNVLVNTSLKYKLIGNQIVIKDQRLEVRGDLATISGFLYDGTNGEGLVYANIISTDQSIGNSSNEYGYFSITLPSGFQTIQFSYVGYEQKDITLQLLRDTVIRVVLQPKAILNEVIIRGELPKVSKQTEDYDQLPIQLLGGMPNLLGESDVLRMAQMRSGIASQVDGFGGLQVRGGSTDQNLVLLDGVPVYNTGHALGLYSIFNSSTIKSAKLIKGGFPARFGGRLSSIMDIRVKEGNNQKLSGDAALSPLMIKATLEGPIVKDKSSFLLSARRTIIDPILKPLSRYQFERTDEEGQVNFVFYDVNAKLNFQLGKNNQIYLSTYLGEDRYGNEVLGVITDQNGNTIQELDINNIEWGNQIATLRWTSNLSKKLFGHASFSYTKFDFDNFEFDRTLLNQGSNDNPPSYVSSLFSSDIKDLIAAYDLDWYANRSYYLRLGVSYTDHTMKPGSDFTANETGLLDNDNLVTKEKIKSERLFESFTGRELRGYIENEFRIGNSLSANLGLHFSSIEVSDVNYQSFQPRFSAKLLLGPKLAFKLGYSKMNQFFHLLSTAGLGLPSDVWLPSTDVLAPEQSTVYSGGFRAALFDQYTISLNAFYKEYENITGFAEGAVFDIRGDLNWQHMVPIGEGISKGIEFELAKEVGNFKGWIAYTLSKSERTFEDINFGKPFRAPNDRRHMLNFNGITKINDNMELSVAWTYGSSLPTTLPASTDPLIVNGQIIYVPTYLSINNAELPPYHKLDIGINLYNQYDWGNQKLSLGAYNVYSRRNPFYIDVVFDESGGLYLFEQVSILPLVPYVNFAVSF